MLWLTNRYLSVLGHCWLGHRTCEIVAEITYNVSSGTLNPTMSYFLINVKNVQKTAVYAQVNGTSDKSKTAKNYEKVI